MFKLLGFICGAVLVSALSIWYFSTQLTPQTQTPLSNEINTMAKSSTKVVDTINTVVDAQQAKPQQQSEQTAPDIDEPVVQISTPVTELAQEEPAITIKPINEPTDDFVKVVDEPMADITFDQIQLPNQIAAIWAPFNSHVKAKNFADYLSEKSGEPLQVTEKDWSFYVTLNYQTEQQLEQAFANIKNIAIGAQLKKMEISDVQ